MIYINKITEILKILYPYKVQPEDVCEVYENVIPQIQKLIDGVDLGYNQSKTDQVGVATLLSDIPIHLPCEIPDSAKSTSEKQTIPDDKTPEHHFTFKEDEKREVDDTWTESEFDNRTHFKNGQNMVIKGESSRIDTTWDYLNEFFNSLPDETVLVNIEGLGKKKRVTLARFYVAHPNFSCHIDKKGYSNVLVKDEVRVNSPTNEIEESGGTGGEAFNGFN